MKAPILAFTLRQWYCVSRNLVGTFIAIAPPHFSEPGHAAEGQEEEEGGEVEDKKEAEEGRRKGSWHSHISIRTRQQELSLGGRQQAVTGDLCPLLSHYCHHTIRCTMYSDYSDHVVCCYCEALYCNCGMLL